MKKLIASFLVLGMLAACTSTQEAALKADAKAGVAWVRSAAITAHGALTAVRANALTIEQGLQVARDAFPPGSDLSTLDDETRGLVELVRTSTDQQLAEQAAAKLIAKLSK